MILSCYAERMKNRPGPLFLTAFDVLARALVIALIVSSCQESPTAGLKPSSFTESGQINLAELDEISGIQAGLSADWIVHNDDGAAKIYLVDLDGRYLSNIKIKGAKNRDWEDLSALPGNSRPVLVIGDTGDNMQLRDHVTLYFVPFPAPDASGTYPGKLKVTHAVNLNYPDGARDCESLAYDPVSRNLLLLTKRDVPPRLYGVNAELALAQANLTLKFLGEVPGLRPPSPADLVRDPDRGAWYAQPTGMDISDDGLTAAVLTYRSVYIFRRLESQTWPEALAGTPMEYIGPKGNRDEAIGFSADQNSVVVTSEGVPATLFKLELVNP